MSECSGHTRAHHALPIYLGGVDNHKDLLNSAGSSSLYQLPLYRAHDKWDCFDGWRWGWGAEGPITHWIELKPENEPQHQANLDCHLVWWTPWSCRGRDEWGNAFLLTALKKRSQNESVRDKVRHALPAQEGDAWQDSRQAKAIQCSHFLMIDHSTVCCSKKPEKLSYALY